MFTEEQAAAYLAGIIDGEGNVSKQNKVVSAGNTDYELIEAMKECCDILGLNCTVYGPRQPKGDNRKPYWDAHIRGRESLQKLLDVVPIRIGRKREVLADQLTRYKSSPRPSREWLHHKYVIEGLTGPQIAELTDTSYARVYKWLRQYGIAVRDTTSRITPPPRDWIVERYHEQGRSPDSIAAELGVSHSTVYRWIHTYGIPIHHARVNED